MSSVYTVTIFMKFMHVSASKTTYYLLAVVIFHFWKVASASEFRVRLAPWNRFSPPVKYFYWPFQGGTSFMDHLCFSGLCLLCLCGCLFICALWSPAWKGLTSWLSFVVSNCEFVTFPFVSCVRCGTWLHRFLIVASLLTYFGTHVPQGSSFNPLAS